MACRGTEREEHCRCQHMDFFIGSYPRVGKDALIQKNHMLDDTTSEKFEDQAILDNTLKSIR